MNFTVDKYGSYSEMINEAVQNKDYTKEYTYKPNSLVSSIAIHGGGIEYGTSELALNLSCCGDYSYYTFKGIRDYEQETPANLELHITSNKFDDPTLIEIVTNSIITVSFHGADEEDDIIYIGGLDLELGAMMKQELFEYNFKIAEVCRNGIEGKSKNNICNKNRRKQGVQIEISSSYRKRFVHHKSLTKEGLFFIAVILKCITNYIALGYKYIR